MTWPGSSPASGQLTRNQFLLRLKVEGYELTIFPDGRAIVSGTDDVAVARAVYAKYVGTNRLARTASSWRVRETLGRSIRLRIGMPFLSCHARLTSPTAGQPMSIQ